MLKKQILVMVLIFVPINFVFAIEPSIHLGNGDETGFYMNFDKTVPERFRAYEFQCLGASIFLLVVYEDGTYIRDLHAYPPPLDPYLITAIRGYDQDINSNGKGWIPIFSSPRSSNIIQFRITKDGKYYFTCFMKKGRKLQDGVKYSNILEVDIRGGKVISSLESSKTKIPPIILESMIGKLREVAEREKATLDDFHWE